MRVAHICVSELTSIGSDNGLSPGWRQAIIWTNAAWNIVNWTLIDKLQWSFNRNSSIFIQENVFESVVCEMAAMLSRPQCVNNGNPYTNDGTIFSNVLKHDIWSYSVSHINSYTYLVIWSATMTNVNQEICDCLSSNTNMNVHIMSRFYIIYTYHACTCLTYLWIQNFLRYFINLLKNKVQKFFSHPYLDGLNTTL